jgi:hypothetical protein
MKRVAKQKPKPKQQRPQESVPPQPKVDDAGDLPAWFREMVQKIVQAFIDDAPEGGWNPLERPSTKPQPKSISQRIKESRAASHQRLIDRIRNGQFGGSEQEIAEELQRLYFPTKHDAQRQREKKKTQKCCRPVSFTVRKNSYSGNMA